MNVRTTREMETATLARAERTQTQPALKTAQSTDAPTDDETSWTFLLVEDHPLFAEGFSTTIRHLFPQARLTLVGKCADALPRLVGTAFDLVFLDLQLPDGNGFDLLQEVRQSGHIQPFVILTGSVAPAMAEKARRFGALGAFSKRVDREQLRQRCLRLLAGIPVFETEPLQASDLSLEHNEPTTRELDVLQHLADGLDNAAICRVLNVSDSTLRTHLRNLFGKLQVTNRTACVVRATRLGWI